MLKELIPLGVGAIFGLGTALMATAAPLYYPNAPSWVWHWLFWGGLALMALMVLDVALLFLWRADVGAPKLWPALILNLSLAVAAGATIWHYSFPRRVPEVKTATIPTVPTAQTAENARRDTLLARLRQEYILSHDGITPAMAAGLENPPIEWTNQRLQQLGETWRVPTDKLEMPPTIEELFKTDFGLLTVMHEFNMSFQNGGTITIKTRVYFDFNAHSKFLGVYIPASPLTVPACVGVVQDHLKLIGETEGGITASTRAPGDWSLTETKDLPFSGRVYVYHESELSLRELADLTDYYKQHGLAVQFRGQNYAIEAYRNRLLKARQQ